MKQRIKTSTNTLMRMLKTANSLGDKSMTPRALQKHRRTLEILGRMASPAKFVHTTEFSVKGIPCEKISPKIRIKKPHRIILYAHGGGYTSGGLSYAQILAGKMALETGLDVISFDYALAPENKYPAQLKDAITVWDRLMASGARPDQIILAGDSAGGNLSLCLTQHLISKRKIRPKALLLFSPWADMVGVTSSYELYGDLDPVLTRSFVEECAAAYIGDKGHPSDSRFSPINGSFEGFPPTLIQVGRTEILLDDSIRLYKRIRSCGSRAVLDIEEAGWHVYQQMPLPMAADAIKRLGDFVRQLPSEHKRNR